jgi:hypothetical protein
MSEISVKFCGMFDNNASASNGRTRKVNKQTKCKQKFEEKNMFWTKFSVKL